MRATRWLAVAGGVAVLLAACLSPPSSPTGSFRPGPTETPATPAPTIPGSPGPSLPSQTDTAWGRIWDALPAGFPAAPGSQLATDTGAGPWSGQLIVPAARDQVVMFYRQAFRDAGYSFGTEGPLEDGSVKVTASSGAACQVEVSVRGTGTQQSMVRVLYGAGCPFA